MSAEDHRVNTDLSPGSHFHLIRAADHKSSISDEPDRTCPFEAQISPSRDGNNPMLLPLNAKTPRRGSKWSAKKETKTVGEEGKEDLMTMLMIWLKQEMKTA